VEAKSGWFVKYGLRLGVNVFQHGFWGRKPLEVEMKGCNDAMVFGVMVSDPKGAEAMVQEATGTDAMMPEAIKANSTGAKRLELRPWKMMLWSWRPWGMTGCVRGDAEREQGARRIFRFVFGLREWEVEEVWRVRGHGL